MEKLIHYKEGFVDYVYIYTNDSLTYHLYVHGYMHIVSIPWNSWNISLMM